MLVSGRTKPIFAFLLLGISMLFFSCKMTTLTGYQYHKNQIGVDISSAKIEYQYPSNAFFKDSAHKQIDEFNDDLLTNLERDIYQNGYLLNKSGSMQTLYLSDCLIDINKTGPKPQNYNGDTLFIHELTSMLICKNSLDSSKIFYSHFETICEFEAIPMKLADRAGFNDSAWFKSKNYYYREKPVSPDLANTISSSLAHNSYNKLDSLSKIKFKNTYPEIYAKEYQKSDGPNAVGEFFGKVLLYTLLLTVLILVQ